MHLLAGAPHLNAARPDNVPELRYLFLWQKIAQGIALVRVIHDAQCLDSFAGAEFALRHGSSQPL